MEYTAFTFLCKYQGLLLNQQLLTMLKNSYYSIAIIWQDYVVLSTSLETNWNKNKVQIKQIFITTPIL